MAVIGAVVIAIVAYYGYAIYKVGTYPLTQVIETTLKIAYDKEKAKYPYNIPRAIEKQFYTYRTGEKDIQMMESFISGGALVAIPEKTLSKSAKKRIIEFYLKKGIDINGKEDDGTILFPAITLADPEMVQWLLDHGADPYKKGIMGLNSLELILFYQKQLKEKTEKGEWVPTQLAQKFDEILKDTRAFQKNQNEVIQILKKHMGPELKVEKEK